MSKNHNSLNDLQQCIIKSLIENNPNFATVSKFQADKLWLLVQDYIRIFPDLVYNQLNFEKLTYFLAEHD
jgi:hypothetical protein